MAKKTETANWEALEQLDEALKRLKIEHQELARANKKSFKDGIANLFAYEAKLLDVKLLVNELFEGIDIVDPEDEEYQRREDEAESEGEDEEEDDEEEEGDGDESEDAH